MTFPLPMLHRHSYQEAKPISLLAWILAGLVTSFNQENLGKVCVFHTLCASIALASRGFEGPALFFLKPWTIMPEEMTEYEVKEYVERSPIPAKPTQTSRHNCLVFVSGDP